MGYRSWLYIEAKAFELSVDERGSVLRLVEREVGFPNLCFWENSALLG